MKLQTIARAASLAGIAIGLGVLVSVGLSKCANADESAPFGFAEAQRTALWKAIQSSPKLVGVDQIIIEGVGVGPIMTGWLQKKNWVNGELTYLEKRFWSRIDRTCPEVKPECFRPVGIWSGSELLAHLTGE